MAGYLDRSSSRDTVSNGVFMSLSVFWLNSMKDRVMNGVMEEGLLPPSKLTESLLRWLKVRPPAQVLEVAWRVSFRKLSLSRVVSAEVMEDFGNSS